MKPTSRSLGFDGLRTTAGAVAVALVSSLIAVGCADSEASFEGLPDLPGSGVGGATGGNAADGSAWFEDAPPWAGNDASNGEGEWVDPPVCEVPAEVSAFVGQMATALCEGFSACCLAQNQTFEVAACEQQIASMYSEYLSEACVKLHAERAPACLQALSAPNPMCGGSDTFWDYFKSACNGAIGGTVPVGSTCNTSFDCAAQPDGVGECNIGVGETIGRCLLANDALQSGEHCDPFEDRTCDASEGLHCNRSTDKCEPRGEEGAHCGYGTPENNAPPCLDGLYCSDATGDCEAIEGVGSACEDDYACGWKARCDASHVCVALAGPGEACSTDDDCWSGACVGSTCRPFSLTLGLLGAKPYCELP